MMCRYQFISWNECATQVVNTTSRSSYDAAELGIIWEICTSCSIWLWALTCSKNNLIGKIKKDELEMLHEEQLYEGSSLIAIVSIKYLEAADSGWHCCESTLCFANQVTTIKESDASWTSIYWLYSQWCSVFKKTVSTWCSEIA